MIVLPCSTTAVNGFAFLLGAVSAYAHLWSAGLEGDGMGIDERIHASYMSSMRKSGSCRWTMCTQELKEIKKTITKA
jgi:hypothetical protein